MTLSDSWDFEHPQGWFDPETGQWTAAEPTLPEFATLTGKTSPATMPSDRPASDKQLAYLVALTSCRIVDDELLADVTARVGSGLTHADCARLIPLLLACRKNPHRHPARFSDQDDDWTTPEGYDDSPDQGIHRFDGGGAW